MKYPPIYILLLFPIQLAFAQPSVTMHGNVVHQNDDMVYIRFYKDYLTNDEGIADSAILDGNGNFSMEFPWESPYHATFFHGGETTRMYLCPNDSLRITLDTKRNDETIRYEGRGACINNYLAQKALKFPPVTSTYKLDEKSFIKSIDSIHLEELNHFRNYFSGIVNKDSSVKSFMEAEEANIKYACINSKINYPAYNAYLHQGRGQLTVSDTYYDFLKGAPVLIPTIMHSIAYLEFIEDYLNKERQKLLAEDSLQSVALHNEQLNDKDRLGELREFVVSKWIYVMLTELNDLASPKQLLNQYKLYINSNKYTDVQMKLKLRTRSLYND
jgi:hypothetical protein